MLAKEVCREPSRQATTLGRAGEDFQRAEAVREDGSFSVRTKWATGKASLGPKLRKGRVWAGQAECSPSIELQAALFCFVPLAV